MVAAVRVQVSEYVEPPLMLALDQFTKFGAQRVSEPAVQSVPERGTVSA